MGLDAAHELLHLIVGLVCSQALVCLHADRMLRAVCSDHDNFARRAGDFRQGLTRSATRAALTRLGAWMAIRTYERLPAQSRVTVALLTVPAARPPGGATPRVRPRGVQCARPGVRCGRATRWTWTWPWTVPAGQLSGHGHCPSVRSDGLFEIGQVDDMDKAGPPGGQAAAGDPPADGLRGHAGVRGRLGDRKWDRSRSNVRGHVLPG